MEEKMVIEEGQQLEENINQQPEKMFTQEQVNEIVRKRLSKQKAVQQAPDEIAAREAAVAAKEKRLDCRDYLGSRGYPAELLDVIDTSDVDAFKEKADKAFGVFNSREPQFVAPLASTERGVGNGPFESAFSSNKKHTPRQYPPRFND